MWFLYHLPQAHIVHFSRFLRLKHCSCVIQTIELWCSSIRIVFFRRLIIVGGMDPSAIVENPDILEYCFLSFFPCFKMLLIEPFLFLFLHAKTRCPLNTAKAYQYPSSKPSPGPVCDQIYDPIRDKISNSISDQTNKQFCDLFYETICGRSREPFHGPFSVPFDQNRQIPGSLQKTVRRESQNLTRQYPPPKLQLLTFLS